MPETTIEAPSQPAELQRTSDAVKGAGNVSESQFARSLLKSQRVAQAAQAPAAEQKPEAEITPSAKPATEETEKSSAEIKPEVTETATPEMAPVEAEVAEETEEVPSPESHSLDPKAQAVLNRRIGKEVAKTRREAERAAVAEAKLVELEARIAAMQPEADSEKQVIVPIPANVPLADINDSAHLDQLKQTARNEIRWAEAQLDDDDFPKEGKITDRGFFATKAQLKELIRNAKICQEDLIPAREKFLQMRSTAKHTAFEKFPFLKDPAAPGFMLAKQAYRENPWLHGLPNADYVVGVQVKGILAMQAEEAAAKAIATAKPTTPAKPRPKPTAGQAEIASDASTSRVPLGTLAKAALEAEEKRVNGSKGLTAKEFAASLVRKQQIRNSQ